MSKGSKRRPQFVSDEVMKTRWEQAFEKQGITFIPCDMGGKIKSLGTLLTPELTDDFKYARDVFWRQNEARDKKRRRLSDERIVE